MFNGKIPEQGTDFFCKAGTVILFVSCWKIHEKSNNHENVMLSWLFLVGFGKF